MENTLKNHKPENLRHPAFVVDESKIDEFLSCKIDKKAKKQMKKDANEIKIQIEKFK